MADPPQDEHIAADSIETDQSITRNESPANDSVVEISDDSTNKSTGGTSRATSSVIEVVEDDSKKRKATENDQTTPAKRQKPTSPENTERKADHDMSKDGGGRADSIAAADRSSSDTRQESTAPSEAGSRKPKPQYASIDEVREKANRILVEKKIEIKELKDEVAELEKEKEKWQRRAGTSEAKLKHWEKTQDAQEKVLWDKALDWKKQEVGKQVDKAKASWQKKFDAQNTRIASLQDRLDDSRDSHDETKEELRETKATLKAQISDLKKQIKDYKPGDSKELKLKIKELNDSDNLLEAQKATNNVLAQRLENRNDDLERVRAQRLEWYNKAQTYHKAWEKEIKVNDQLKVEHEEDLQQQYNMWQIQANNSAESQVRLVAKQRGNFDLNNAHDRVLQEKEQLKKQLKAAKAQIQQLKASAAPQPPRPAQVLSTPSDSIRTPTSQLQEVQAQDTSRKVPNGSESTSAAAPPKAESASQHEAAESRAKTEVDATVDNDRQVTQIVEEMMADARRPRGEPHSAPLASGPRNEITRNVEKNEVTREADAAVAEVQSQDMQAPSEAAGHNGEDEASNEIAADPMQDVQSAGQNAGHDQEDESYAEASEEQIQSMQAAVQNAGEHTGPAQVQFSSGGTEPQAENIQTAHQGAGPAEADTTLQASDQTQRESPVSDTPRSTGGFSFPKFWRSDRSDGSSA